MNVKRVKAVSPRSLPLANRQIAESFLAIAELLEGQGANSFRVRAYRNAASVLEELSVPVHQILISEGVSGLTRLPGIGQSLARAIEQLAMTGRLGLLERLRGAGLPATLFASVPGIGRKMAARIHEVLGIETLAELEAASYDGRLTRVPGMGRRRIQAVRESLAGRFRRRPSVPATDWKRIMANQPPVEELFDIDKEYRDRANAGTLPRIAPKRFNPACAAWLPVLHTVRGSRHYTALFSNTARAHELGATGDWVVIYRDDHEGDGQWTVVTSRLGDLAGRRIVRGRESECKEVYRDRPIAVSS
ncbi:MAG TPA: helix-hairpin-helix domain-containing protein [Pirellulales bacterium]|nr:helix-hairpin-helix domain-containing protein [Pirellulales bacterium]